ncbi:sugar ABC transporter substrate-binding protein [Tessaracoccus sp. MC1865]|uniref:sugar ABC transporter substrate-binding protein n=1 Tax=Tessaracoccus sp. MC1865 TaxID=2760310 RepID=UPI0016027507|nr:sugar ABC transporter substrate-binding protein [Tessaracoccus sp. MC1865]MBB1482920.1 sugar ABC transporter substrate-binding protein [Tessaracoccus sp. MC1865]
MNKALVSAAAALALATLAACGGETTDNTTPPVETAAEETSPVAPAEETTPASPGEESSPAEGETTDEASPSESESPSGEAEFVEFREAEPGSGEGMKIGLIALNDTIPFSKLVSDSIKEQAEKAGAELVFCDSKLDAATALDCAKNFATQGVEGYLNFQPVSDAAQSICDAGPDVPVIAIDIAQGDCQDAFMGANNSRAGFVAGEGLGNFMKEQFDCEYDAYVSLEDLGVGEVNTLRMDGIREGFQSVCEGELKNERVLDAGRQDIALTKFGDTLTALPGMERIIVVGINDDSVLGAYAAARTAGRGEHLYMAGMGADPTAHCEIANNPNWAGDAAFFPERYGEIGVPYLIDLINGEEVPENLLVNHIFVNKDNVSEFYDVSGC